MTFDEACQVLASRLDLPVSTVAELASLGIAGVSQGGVINTLGIPLGGMSATEREYWFITKVEEMVAV